MNKRQREFGERLFDRAPRSYLLRVVALVITALAMALIAWLLSLACGSRLDALRDYNLMKVLLALSVATSVLWTVDQVRVRASFPRGLRRSPLGGWAWSPVATAAVLALLFAPPVFFAHLRLAAVREDISFDQFREACRATTVGVYQPSLVLRSGSMNILNSRETELGDRARYEAEAKSGQMAICEIDLCREGALAPFVPQEYDDAVKVLRSQECGGTGAKALFWNGTYRKEASVGRAGQTSGIADREYRPAADVIEVNVRYAGAAHGLQPYAGFFEIDSFVALLAGAAVWSTCVYLAFIARATTIVLTLCLSALAAVMMGAMATNFGPVWGWGSLLAPVIAIVLMNWLFQVRTRARTAVLCALHLFPIVGLLEQLWSRTPIFFAPGGSAWWWAGPLPEGHLLVLGLAAVNIGLASIFHRGPARYRDLPED